MAVYSMCKKVWLIFHVLVRARFWLVKMSDVTQTEPRTLQRQDGDAFRIDRLHHRGQVKHELNPGSLRSLCRMHSQTRYPLHKLHKQ